MKNQSPLNFAHQNLRNRSFRGQNLIGADFSGSDIRGCDFSYALLQGANFKQVKAGQTFGHLIFIASVAVVVAIATFHAVSQLIFSAVGVTPDEPAWIYALALFWSLNLAGVSSAIRGMTHNRYIIKCIATAVSGATSAALLALFYLHGNAATLKNPKSAVMTLVFVAIVMAIVGFYSTKGLVAVGIGVAGAVAAYGFTFLVVGVASAYLSTQNFVWGLLWSVMALGAIALLIISLKQSFKDMTSSFATSFRGADLTNANFEGAKLENTDFSGAGSRHP
ncbi:pentapeptide repeat-containing protein [Chlorogloeopsis sp. ULAP02]|uniref:pentapeptide repeat-containing protein n=1 Tax=Chlorogloeopsis sp. ULAP02 TaxID=3107926 RepID=UPI0031358B0B